MKYISFKNQSGIECRLVLTPHNNYEWYERRLDLFGNQFFHYVQTISYIPPDVEVLIREATHLNVTEV